MQVSFPYTFDGRGRTAEANEDKHVRDLIEQILFTSPGERVHRPDFGCGLMQLVFAPNSPELASSTQALVQGSLQRWLGDRALVESVSVQALDNVLEVIVAYRVRMVGERKVAQFRRTA